MAEQNNTSEASRPLEQGTFYLFGNLIRPYDIEGPQSPQQATMNRANMGIQVNEDTINEAPMVTGGAKDANIVATVNENPNHIEVQNDDGDGENDLEITPLMEKVLEPSMETPNDILIDCENLEHAIYQNVVGFDGNDFAQDHGEVLHDLAQNHFRCLVLHDHGPQEDLRMRDNLNLVGRCVSKVIDSKRHMGWVAAYDTETDMFTVMYEHSIVEEMDLETLEEHLPTVPEIQNYFAERLHSVHENVEPQGARPVATMIQATSSGQDQRVESSEDQLEKQTIEKV